MEEQKLPVPGPRQTVDRVVMPKLGPGRLVWRNGPALFFPDSGDLVIHLHKVDIGGASSEPPRSWQSVWLEPGRRVEADLVERGAWHSRFYSPLFGDGWLVDENKKDATGRSEFWERFEDLEGNVKLRFQMIELCVGRPAYREKMQRKSAKMPAIDDPDEMNWSTYRAVDGSIFTFRRGGPPPPEGTFIPVRPDTYACFSPKARKAYDAAKKLHEAQRGDRPLQLELDTKAASPDGSQGST